VPPVDLGIGYPVIVSSPPIWVERVPGLVLPGAEGTADTPAVPASGFPAGGSGGSPTMRPPGSMGPGMMPPGMMGSGGMVGAADGTPLRRQDFILQFTWQPVVPGAPKPAAEGDAAAGTTGN
jgi:hypothetical protein